MKRFLLFIVLMLAVSAFADEQVLWSGKVENGGWGGPVMKMTIINGCGAVLIGGQGMWLINHTFALGGGGYGMVSDQDGPEEYVPITDATTSYFPTSMNMGYGGVVLSYLRRSDVLFHPTLDLLIGGGKVVLYHHGTNGRAGEIGHDGFFVLEPSVNGELNIVSFMRASIGVGYSFVSGVTQFGYSNADFTNVTGTIMLKFGKF
jgi:hypothetical protein